MSIFIAVSLQQQGYSYQEGNAALILSGAALAFIGVVPPVGRFFTMVSSPLCRIAAPTPDRPYSMYIYIQLHCCLVDLVLLLMDGWMD